jgi:hypothetical protein
MQDIIIEHYKFVIVKSIHQWKAYGELSEGLPTDRTNKNIQGRLPGQINQPYKTMYELQITTSYLSPE